MIIVHKKPQVLSKKALKLFIEKAMSRDKDSDYCKVKTQTGQEDVELGRYQYYSLTIIVH